jgi:hypothetical protein
MLCPHRHETMKTDPTAKKSTRVSKKGGKALVKKEPEPAESSQTKLLVK